MEDKILAKVKKQLAKDYNCSVKDFENKDNIITEAKVIRGNRIYMEDNKILKILIFNGKAIISTNSYLKEWCHKDIAKVPGEWMFLTSVLRRIDKRLGEFGYEIDNIHHCYLPHYEESYSYKDDKSLRWYEGEEIEQFRNDKRFDEAFAFDRRYPDVLGVAALNEEGDIIGMAGASEDCEEMWQIGINVLPEAEGQGIGKKLVSVLKNEILRRGKVPFYSTVESHIISQKTALTSGFYPVFAEVMLRKK